MTDEKQTPMDRAVEKLRDTEACAKCLRELEVTDALAEADVCDDCARICVEAVRDALAEGREPDGYVVLNTAGQVACGTDACVLKDDEDEDYGSLDACRLLAYEERERLGVDTHTVAPVYIGAPAPAQGDTSEGLPARVQPLSFRERVANLLGGPPTLTDEVLLESVAELVRRHGKSQSPCAAKPWPYDHDDTRCAATHRDDRGPVENAVEATVARVTFTAKEGAATGGLYDRVRATANEAIAKYGPVAGQEVARLRAGIEDAVEQLATADDDDFYSPRDQFKHAATRLQALLGDTDAVESTAAARPSVETKPPPRDPERDYPETRATVACLLRLFVAENRVEALTACALDVLHAFDRERRGGREGGTP